MLKLIPDMQMGGVGGLLLYAVLAIVGVVALFTTGAGPVVITAVVLLVIAGILYFILKRVWFRLARGPRGSP